MLRSNHVNIENLWSQNADYITSIQKVSSGEDVAIWSALYYHYGRHLLENGYATKSLNYIEKSIVILQMNKGLIGSDYMSMIHTMLEFGSYAKFDVTKNRIAVYAW